MPKVVYTQKDDEELYDEMKEELEGGNADEAFQRKFTARLAKKKLLQSDVRINDYWAAKTDVGRKKNYLFNTKGQTSQGLENEKEKYILDYLSADLGLYGKDYEEFENTVRNEHKELLDKLVKETDATIITDCADSLKIVFYGKKLGKQQQEIEEAQKDVDTKIKRGILLSQKSRHTNEMHKTIMEREQRAVKDALFTFTASLYDGATKKDPASKQQQKEYAREVAKLFYYNNEKTENNNNQYASEFPDIKKMNYNLDQYLDAAEQRQENLEMYIDNMVSDPSFVSFVQEIRSNTARDQVDLNRIVGQWTTYMKDLGEARDEYTSQLKLFHQGEKVKESFYLFQRPANVEDIIDKEDVEQPTKEELKEKCKKMVEDSKKEKVNVRNKDFFQVANLVVADTLASSVADKTFFSLPELQINGKYSLDQVNKAVVEMRNQVINDPIFEEVMSQHLPVSEVVSAYKAQVKAAVNERIADQKRIDKELKANKGQEKEAQQMSQITVSLDEKEYQSIRNTYDRLVVYNEGKKPSEEMKKMMNALKVALNRDEKLQGRGFERQHDGTYQIKADVMNELNKATLNYYKERQGRLFAPFTDAGKARLGAVEKMSFVTDNAMRGVRAKMENMKNKEAVQPKTNF